MSDEYVTWPERCGTCAYRAGTNANMFSLTQLKANLCLQTSEPFYCHEDPQGRALCKGWVEAMETRLAKGNRGEEVEWRRDVLLAVTEVICDYEDAVKAGRSFDVVAAMRQKVMEAR